MQTTVGGSFPHPLASLSDLGNDAHISDHPDDQHEPRLCMDNIQGNGIAGFNKDFQRFISLKLIAGQEGQFRNWLAERASSFATAAEVLAFNRLFKALKDRRGKEGTITATWTNILFSANGIRQLGFSSDVDAATDSSFRSGLAARSSALGDAASGDGASPSWKFGGPSNEADVVLILAADKLSDINEAEADLLSSLNLQFSNNQLQAASGAQFVVPLFRDVGETLPEPLTGHEHFGWLDGVSQPAVRGVISADKTPSGDLDLLTARQNPSDAGEGQPGQDCIEPGAFVFGYVGPMADLSATPAVVQNGSNFYDDGSLVVYRRLAQRVADFRAMIAAKSLEHSVPADVFGAKLVGRFKDGSPIVANDTSAHPTIGTNDAIVNWFSFQAPLSSGKSGDASQFDLSSAGTPPSDPNALKCPVAAHIRKSNPRDDIPRPATNMHRLLRRGIPYGPPLPEGASEDHIDRGLIFVAYQTSIVNQFEFVTENWINNPDFAKAGSGVDPIIGAPDASGKRTTEHIIVNFADGDSDNLTIEIDQSFVIPTGGGYFFSPSIDKIAFIAGVQNSPTRCLGTHPILPPPIPPTPVPPTPQPYQ